MLKEAWLDEFRRADECLDQALTALVATEKLGDPWSRVKELLTDEIQEPDGLEDKALVAFLAGHYKQRAIALERARQRLRDQYDCLAELSLQLTGYCGAFRYLKRMSSCDWCEDEASRMAERFQTEFEPWLKRLQGEVGLRLKEIEEELQSARMNTRLYQVASGSIANTNERGLSNVG